MSDLAVLRSLLDEKFSNTQSILGRHSLKVRRRRGEKYHDIWKGGMNVGSEVGQKKDSKAEASGNKHIRVTLKVTSVHI